ncbi:MAG: alkaline phosphatase family protein [Planctomycetes bacterium]|nr:alkaline phosphatase family protein [Planctomycetota bacterium]
MGETVRPLVVALVVGLSRRQIGEDTPWLAKLAAEGFAAPIDPVMPAVTCSVQSTYLTGKLPSEHGIVGNGWYWRDRGEVNLWRQSNALVQGPKVWHAAKALDPSFTCAKLFWWFNMFAEVDWSVTPRPAYLADGRKVPDIYTEPPELRCELNDKLGPFPLFKFWGPATSIESSRWITSAAAEVIHAKSPSLTLVYLPHLDYDHQRYGPDHPESRRSLREVDAQVGHLAEAADAQGAELLVLSEYGIEPVDSPIHINRALREGGYLRPWLNLDAWELLEPAACRAFAVADHQLAHVYVHDSKDVNAVKALLEALDGVDRVYDAENKAEIGLDHPRSGELIAIAAPGHWFTYYYWLDDRLAPDFARTVEIHKKPGYDPCELFLDPRKPLAKGKIAWSLARKLLGFRYLMDVIPLDASLVKGSHGRAPSSPEHGAVLIGPKSAERERFAATEIHDLILSRLQRDG